MTIPRLIQLVAATSLLGVASISHAETTSTIEAIDNATVKPAGPRTGGSGKNFFNVEGDGNNLNASYGVIDFNLGLFGLDPNSVGSLLNISLSLTQSNAAFTVAGPLRFFLTTDTTTDIQPANTSLIYNSPSADNNYGVGTSLGTLYEFGTGTFDTTGNVNSGTVDLYTFSLASLDTTAASYLLNAINTGSTIRVVIAPDASATAATWAGFSNSTYTGPQVSFDYAPVPEPPVFALIVCGLIFAAFLAKRRRSALTKA